MWQIAVPAGHSSPVIWDTRIFLTASDSANPKELITLAIDREAGRTLWRQVVQAETQGRFHPLNNPASSTPAVDDKHVYVYFGTYGLLCYDHAGNEVWQRRIDTPQSKYGVATSPILYEDKVILVLDDDGGSSRLLAVHRDTGKMDTLLRIFDHDKNGIISKEEWMQTMSGFAALSQPTLVAIRPGATKDARRSHVAWEIKRGIPETSSLLYCRGRLYLLRDGGLLTCLRASTGTEIFRERIGASGQYIASPIVVGDKIIVASVPGVVTIIQVDDKLNVLARNNFGEQIFATPALFENRIYLRTAGHLYALGE